MSKSFVVLSIIFTVSLLAVDSLSRNQLKTSPSLNSWHLSSQHPIVCFSHTGQAITTLTPIKRKAKRENTPRHHPMKCKPMVSCQSQAGLSTRCWSQRHSYLQIFLSVVCSQSHVMLPSFTAVAWQRYSPNWEQSLTPTSRWILTDTENFTKNVDPTKGVKLYGFLNC